MKLRKTEPISCGLSIFSGLIYPTTTCFFPTPSGAGRRRTISVDGWTWNRPGVAGKRVLDCGCGPGRHTWALAHLGAQVTAFDMSDSGLAEAKRECANYPTAIIEKRNILEPLPYSTDFDIVWSYGVIQHTGDTYGALSNIARHVRPGGLIYLMVYPEPERTNFDSYRYYHEVYAIRRLTDHLDLRKKAEVMKLIQGDRRALSWFDAISSRINDLYTFEEASELLLSLGFVDVKRTMPEEHSLNVVATRAG
jgi:2-polyprenyl-3-methyl-5-hydroxy-6-metoxy-1,4-benzoquinol methylase